MLAGRVSYVPVVPAVYVAPAAVSTPNHAASLALIVKTTDMPPTGILIFPHCRNSKAPPLGVNGVLFALALISPAVDTLYNCIGFASLP